MISRLLALVVLAGTTFAQTATPSASSTIDVWPEGKMPGKGAKEAEAEVRMFLQLHMLEELEVLV